MMKTASPKRPVRSHALRRTNLLSATALVAAGTLAAPSVQANSVLYTVSGTYTDAITVGATDSIRTQAGVNAVFEGTVTYSDPAVGYLFLGDTSANNGTIVFAPTSMVGTLGYDFLDITGGVVRFGSNAARTFYSQSGTGLFVSGGTFDLGGTSQTVHTLGQLGVSAGTITNNGPGAATLTITNSIDFNGAITDGAGALGLRPLRFEGLGSTLALNDTISLANDINLAAGATAVFTVGSGTGRLMGDIASNGGDLFKDGNGELVLGGAVDTGRIFLNRGSLTSAATLGGNISDTASIIVSQNATLNVQGNEKIYEVIGTGQVALANGAQLTLGRDGSGGLDYSTSSSNLITGQGSLRKEGDNRQTLRGANTYSGGTTLAAGTLRAGLNGGQFGSGLADHSAKANFNVRF
jgi:fibronectin-binding autotransporter adhesin